MDNLKQLKNEEIVDLIKSGKVEVADIVDSGICPTCFDKRTIIFYMETILIK